MGPRPRRGHGRGAMAQPGDRSDRAASDPAGGHRHRPRLGTIAAYVVALGATLAVALLGFGPLVTHGDRMPFVAFVLVVTIAALFGGFWPAVVATALNALSAAYLFLGPPYDLAVDE